jgi:hypothetical protein
MKIDYTIEEVRPNVFAVIVKDHYHRAMLFCRVQEFYESPNHNLEERTLVFGITSNGIAENIKMCSPTHLIGEDSTYL